MLLAKLVVVLSASLLCFSCAYQPTQFVEGKVALQPPLNLSPANQGANGVEFTAFSDGGTKMIQILDGKGKSYKLYIDHRVIWKEPNKEGYRYPGTLYLDQYPENVGSICITDEDFFFQCCSPELRKIIKDLQK
jgi:hypothetical protein